MIYILSIVWLLLSILPALADEVRMKNGDRLSGEIIRLEKDRLTVKTGYAAEKISVAWKEVDCIISERALPVEFSDNEFLIGTISCPESGQIQVDSTIIGTTIPVPLSQLLAVNPSTYSGFLSLGSTLNSGNTDTKALNTSTLFQVRTHKHRFTVDANYNYEEAGGEETVRNASGSLKYDFFAREKVYSYAQSLNEQDSFSNLNLRNTEGLGMGYQFSDSPQFSLFTEAGVSYFNEDVIIGDDKRDVAGRWAVGLDWEAVPNRLKVFHRQEGYYSVVANSVVLRTEQGFRVPLIDAVSANFEADYRYNSSPEEGKKNYDLSLILGFVYEYAYW